jgi:hypothetical protein
MGRKWKKVVVAYLSYHGPKYENGEWRSRTNRELEDMKEKIQ